MAYFTYILENSDGRFYVGQTEDLDRRVQQHNNPTHSEAKYTTKHGGPWRLVWHEEHPARKSAMARERQIKAMKSARWIREELLSWKSESRRAGINR